MTLLVLTPPGRVLERRYVLDVILTQWWGVAWEHQDGRRSDVRIQMAGREDLGAVTLPDILFGTPSADWLSSRSLPPTPGLPARPAGVASTTLGPSEHVPVLYGPPGRDDRALVEGDHEVRVDVDVFGSVFFMLTRYEEIVCTTRDAHDRFPASASTAHRGGFLGFPLVDAYAELLWAACRRVWPRLSRHDAAYDVHVTHDVDHPLSTIGQRPVDLVRRFAGDLVRRRDPGTAVRRALAQVGARRGDHRHDPNNTFDFLMDVSEACGLRSAFYFLPHDEMRPSTSFVLFDHPWVQDLVRHIHRRGHEVGLHTSLGTYRDPRRTAEEFSRLREISAARGVHQPVWGGRQHYLQWANPQTWRNWESAGLDYDCTLAFSDAVGFRAGTCREFTVFDLVEQRSLRLTERPFQVMDVTLFGYMSFDRDGAHRAAVDIARECRRFGGTFGLLWHNDSVLRSAAEKRWYRELVEAVAPRAIAH